MYFCSDIKSVEYDKSLNKSQSFYNQISLCNNKNLECSINELKKSLDQKKGFLKSYKQITALNQFNKNSAIHKDIFKNTQSILYPENGNENFITNEPFSNRKNTKEQINLTSN